jgi:hypothetical protein
VRYLASIDRSLKVAEEDLAVYGRAEVVSVAEAAGPTVYELPGVDPQQVLLIKARDGEDVRYVLLLRQGAAMPVPGLCQYVSDYGCPSP